MLWRDSVIQASRSYPDAIIKLTGMQSIGLFGHTILAGLCDGSLGLRESIAVVVLYGTDQRHPSIQ
jgi:hypothetical protein